MIMILVGFGRLVRVIVGVFVAITMIVRFKGTAFAQVQPDEIIRLDQRDHLCLGPDRFERLLKKGL